MKASIITIGDEILIGQILDTNSQYISQSLNRAGITVLQRTSIGDDQDRITSCLDETLSQSDIIIITGGLGPTKDDITKHTLASYFSSSMRYDQRVADHVKTLLERRGIEFTPLNQAQAQVPECCTVLFNSHGTAPGMWFEKDGKVVISLPGVPFEMKHLMEDEVMPRLKKHFSLKSIVHKTMITSGIAESILAQTISEWEENLPQGLRLAYLPAPNIVRLRLSAYDVDAAQWEEIISREFDKLYHIIPDNIVGFEGATVQQLVHDFMLEHKLTLASAESCTGGNIASLFTAMPGASGYFLCGVVSYSNEAKENVLGVKRETLEEYGAVSESVAMQMAQGVRNISGADYGIATTGIAGPGGGTAQKPVGTVWFGVSTPKRTFAVMKDCGTDRSQVISRASAYAISLLEKELRLH